MALETGRPRQKNQASRKGKKAWRKNIDLDQFEKNLEEQRDAEIVLGPNEQEFTIDKVGTDEGFTPEMKKEKKLKSYEILHARSAVPALIPQHKKKDKPKSKVAKDRKQLLERAGFTDKSSRVANVERDGILRSGNTSDLWGSAPAASAPQFVVENRANQAPSSRPQKSLQPDAPLPGTRAVELPLAGQSYNPALEDWKRAILTEHHKLEKQEEKRVQAEEQQARIDAIIAETEARLAESGSEGEDESDEEADSGDLGKLSVNPPTKLKRKTRADRNRIHRHKMRLFELSQLKQKKAFMRKLAEEAANKRNREELVTEEVKQKPTKKLLKAHSAHPVMEEPLTVKLSDELDDSLRRLKPEGDLMKERVRSLQARGIIDARVPVKKPKSRTKMVEKHSYKYFE